MLGRVESVLLVGFVPGSSSAQIPEVEILIDTDSTIHYIIGYTSAQIPGIERLIDTDFTIQRYYRILFIFRGRDSVRYRLSTVQRRYRIPQIEILKDTRLSLQYRDVIGYSSAQIPGVNSIRYRLYNTKILQDILQLRYQGQRQYQIQTL